MKDIIITQQYVCQIRSQRHIEVCALQDGYLQEILVKEGQPVKHGDVMFKILPTLYKARLAAEVAEAKLAQIEFDNTKKLFESTPPVVSNQEVALAKAKLEKANAKQSVWIAVLPRVLGKVLPVDDDSSIKDELARIEAISGGVTVDDDVKLELALAVKDAEVAREISTEINEGLNIVLTLVAVASRENRELAPALDALKTIKASAKGNAIILKGAVTAEMIEKAMRPTTK